MKKYYTPDISEFHVGFEFEVPNPTDKRSWIKCVFMDGESAEKYCDEYESRVKYLNKEDIIDLEFFHATSSGVCTVYGKRHPKANIYPELAYILRDNHATKKIEINQVLIGGNQITLFEGIIKNKSELRKLLKQLGI